MSNYDYFKNSYLENEKYIKKVLASVPTKSVLGDKACLVLKYLIDESKKKIDNKPSDLRKFSRNIFIPIKNLQEANYKGKLYPINPKNEGKILYGEECFKSN